MTAEREQKYDVLRGLAILFVLLIHISSDYALAPEGSAVYTVFNILNKLFNTAVPTFVALTVFLGLKSGKRRSVIYVLKKIGPITALYLFWSFVYLFYNIKFNGFAVPMLGELGARILLQGEACYHLYYIVMLIQLYAVIAALSHLPLQRLRPKPWLPLAGGALQMAVFFVYTALVIYPLGFYNTALLVIFYITAITYGLCLASDKTAVEAGFKKRWWVYALILTGTVLARAWLYTHDELFAGDFLRRNSLEWGIRELFIFGGIPVMFLLAELLKKSSPLALLGRHSLGIYFFHPLLLYIIDSLTGGLNGEIMIATGMALKLGVLVAAAFIYSLAAELVFKKKPAAEDAPAQNLSERQ